MRRSIIGSVALLFLVAIWSTPAAAADPPNFAGTYKCAGVTGDGKKYEETIVLTSKPEGGYHMKWSNGKAEASWVGERLLITDGRMVGIYQRKMDGKLVGSQFEPGVKGEGKETWTPIKK